MKQDIDALMAERNLDAIFVRGKVLGNSPLVYVLNGARMTQGIYVKKRGETPVLVVSPIERDEALQAGYPTVLASKYRYSELLREHQGDVLSASVAYYCRIFEDLGVTGRVGCYGYLDQGYAFVLLTALARALPTVELVGEIDNAVLLEARATKDAAEIERIRSVGQRTASVVADTVHFLQLHAVGPDQTLRKHDGSALTIGDVHAHITRLIALQGLEDPDGFIFAAGRDAGVPHSRGRLDTVVRLGETIVFDIFPRESGGGYFYDMTRTFCLGYAPEPARCLYADVLECLKTMKAALRAGELTRRYQQMTCEFFHTRGHPTIGEDPAALSGYVHSLGHGVGLDIHESPSFQDSPSNTVRLTPGHVFTAEPGVYYPEQGLGCRLEDTLYMAENGEVHTLVDYPFELVIPMEGVRT